MVIHFIGYCIKTRRARAYLLYSIVFLNPSCTAGLPEVHQKLHEKETLQMRFENTVSFFSIGGDYNMCMCGVNKGRVTVIYGLKILALPRLA